MPCPDFANKSIRRQGQCSTWTDGYWVQSATIGLPSARGDSTWDEHTWSASSGTVQLKAVVLDSLLITVCPFSVSSVAFWIIISRVILMTLLISGCSNVLHGT